MRFLSDDQREKIGFKYIMDKLEVITPFGKDEKRALKPFDKEEKALLLLQLENLNNIVKAYRDNKESFDNIINHFRKIKDIRGSLRKCLELLTLDDVEFFEIKGFCMTIKKIINLYAGMDLGIINIQFSSMQEVIDLLSPEGDGSPTFYIYDKYSEKLKEARIKKRAIENQIYLFKDADKLQQMKSKRLEFVIEEENEELVIRKRLTEKLNGHAKDIFNNIDALGKLDLIIAKVLLAIQYRAVKPRFTDNYSICFKGAFNPEVEESLQKKDKSFTPINLEFKSGTTIITGSNMGGKSIALKTMLLNLLLASMGFFVFAETAKLPMLDFIFYLSGDNQSTVHGLSTFGEEILSLKEVLDYVKSDCGFAALDEFARSTNPKEGNYFVKSLCRYLNNFSSFSLVATHYDGIVDDTMIHYEVKGLKDIKLDQIIEQLKQRNRDCLELLQELMDYRFEKVAFDKEVPKEALNISILLGLNKELVDLIRSHYKDEDCFK